MNGHRDHPIITGQGLSKYTYHAIWRHSLSPFVLPLLERVPLKVVHFSLVWPSACTQCLFMKGGLFASHIGSFGNQQTQSFMPRFFYLVVSKVLSFVLLYAVVKAQILIMFSHLRSFLCNLRIGWPHSGICVVCCPQLSWKLVSYMVHYFCSISCLLLWAGKQLPRFLQEGAASHWKGKQSVCAACQKIALGNVAVS